MECFAKAFNYFRKKLYFRCLKGFWIRLWGRCSRLRKLESSLEICLIFVKARTRRVSIFGILQYSYLQHLIKSNLGSLFQTDLRKDSRQAVQCGFKTFWNYTSCSQIRLEILMFSTIVSSLPQLMELVCIGKTNQTGANIGKTNQTVANKDFVETWFVKSYLWKHTIPFVRNI